MNLLPRDHKFFELFLDHVRYIRKASALLLEAAMAGNSHLDEAATQIRDMEGKADEIIHEIYVRLNSTFITPLDPEDIQTLASALDDVLDGIEDTAHRIAAYALDSVPPTMVELCRIVTHCTQSLEAALIALSNRGPLMEHCIEVNRLEEEADQVLRTAITQLFREEKNPIHLLKLKEIYEFLEATTDRCEDVSDVLQNIQVKNS